MLRNAMDVSDINANPLEFMTVTTNLSITKDLRKKASPMVIKLIALEMIDLHYPKKDWLGVYTDGTRADKANTAGGGVYCKLFSQYATVGINKSNFDGELGAICLALQQLLYKLQAFEVCVVDTKAAIQAVSSNSQPKSNKINDIKQALKHIKALKKIVIFQWLSSHVGLEGNEIAEKLAKKGTTLHTIETPLQADILSRQAGCNKEMDNHKIWAEYKGKPRKEAVANFRLKTGHDCLAAHLRKIGIYESSESTFCQMPNSTMDEEHLLYCPKLDTDQQMLKNTKLYCDATAMMR
jgi:ribonuclease HI